uniref:Large ribosomal subunit protein bL20c n=1 Tax=Monopsis debilis var. debilis TaxID=2041136 RepID=A0A291F169_9ASTR|nr:ribosomal protein L20 [Monopsis debilis var. debilis]
MNRTTRGYIARRRRTKRQSFVSSFRGARLTTQQEIRALASSDQSRIGKKRDFRRLWITRINSVIRGGWIHSSYSRLIHDLYTRQLLLNRKIISQISIANQKFLYLPPFHSTPPGVSPGVSQGKTRGKSKQTNIKIL